MLFTEPRFLLFFLVVFLVHWALPGPRQRKSWLLLCSLFFYACWDWRFLFLLAGQALVDYVAGLILRSPTPLLGRRFWVALSLTLNLAILGFFKYFNFFVASGVGLLHALGLPVAPRTLEIVLPVGISFITFQSMSYTIDVYRGKLKPVVNLVDYMLFICFFTHLVAGPIVRAAHLLPQIHEPRRLATVDFRWCFTLFLIGFIKKSLISDHLTLVVDQVFANPGLFTALSIWIGTLFYAVQIYCDFSGYTDMAIACAALLGYDLGLNFNFPYLAASITDFWRRWHISLSNWLRDFLYIPLGGNQGGLLRTYRNLLVTMLLGGLWHGANWTFVVWGALHGGALILHKEWTRHVRLPAFGAAAMQWLGPLLTLWWVCLAWIFFRANDLAQAWTACQAFVLLRSPGVQTIDARLLWLLPMLALVHWATYRRWWDLKAKVLPDWAYAAAYGCAVALVLFLVPLKVRPFIYFQF
jgi:alginate O-acetyltransferase complex protein AlgI